MDKNPFARAIAMMAMIRDIMQLGDVAQRQERLRRLNPYRSRGKGRGTPSRNFGNRSGVAYPHHSARERARNLRHRYDEHPRAVKLAHERRAS